MSLKPKLKSGRKIGAIAHANNGVVYFLGYGHYRGDQVPDDKAVGILAEMCRKYEHKTPKLVLESGSVVYGCECWWGSVQEVKKIISAAREVVDTSVEYMRIKAVAEAAGPDKNPPHVDPN